MRLRTPFGAASVGCVVGGDADRVLTTGWSSPGRRAARPRAGRWRSRDRLDGDLQQCCGGPTGLRNHSRPPRRSARRATNARYRPGLPSAARTSDWCGVAPVARDQVDASGSNAATRRPARAMSRGHRQVVSEAAGRSSGRLPTGRRGRRAYWRSSYRRENRG